MAVTEAGIWVSDETVAAFRAMYAKDAALLAQRAVEAERREAELRADPWLHTRSPAFDLECSEVLLHVFQGTATMEELRAVARHALNEYMDRRVDEYTGGVYFYEYPDDDY